MSSPERDITFTTHEATCVMTVDTTDRGEPVVVFLYCIHRETGEQVANLALMPDEAVELGALLIGAAPPRRRVQLSRQRGWRKPADAVVVARPTKWGNPYREAEHGRRRAIDLYRLHLRDHPALVDAARAELAGRPLACWCPLDEPCHADVLIEVASGGEP